MSRHHLLDTNTASFIVRGQPPQVLQRLQAMPPGTVGLSSITRAELRYGLARKPSAAALAAAVEALLHHVPTHPWDETAAEHYGALRARLEAAGTPLGNLDTLIAAHALALGAVLVSNDQAFRRVEGLLLVDWV